MKVVQHNPNCAIYRRGDLQAWCDCGAEPPVMQELRENIAERRGEARERARIVKWIRARARFLGAAGFTQRQVDLLEIAQEIEDEML